MRRRIGQYFVNHLVILDALNIKSRGIRVKEERLALRCTREHCSAQWRLRRFQRSGIPLSWEKVHRHLDRTQNERKKSTKGTPYGTRATMAARNRSSTSTFLISTCCFSEVKRLETQHISEGNRNGTTRPMISEPQ